MNKVATQFKKIKIRRGDTVKVLRGKDRGKTGKVMRVLPLAGRVIVEGVQLVTKHTRPRRQGEKSQRVQVAAALPVANVQVVCSKCQKPTRVKITIQDDRRVRVCKHCQAVLIV